MIEFPHSLPVPDEVLDIARRLEGAGFETWCVGGAVRDNLLQLENRDFDLATAAPPDAVRRLFRHTIPIGVEHGTVAILFPPHSTHEVTTFRRDVRTDGRHATVEFGVSLEDDLARRDFTVNAIAFHPLRHEWRDPFGGREDLARRVIRAVGDPRARFREDYLRILRAVRFAARFSFDVEPATWEAAREAAPGLERLSAERVRDEWFRALDTAAQPSRVLQLWDECGGRARWLPEVETRRAPGLDRFARRDPVLMTAYVSRDPGLTLTRLRCSSAEIARAVAAAPGGLPRADDPAGVRRWMSARGSAVDDLLELMRIDLRPDAAALAAAVAAVRSSRAPLTLGALAISGDDLKRAGVPAGRSMGVILRTLLDDVLGEPALNEPGVLLERARKLAREQEGP